MWECARFFLKTKGKLSVLFCFVYVAWLLSNSRANLSDVLFIFSKSIAYTYFRTIANDQKNSDSKVSYWTDQNLTFCRGECEFWLGIVHYWHIWKTQCFYNVLNNNQMDIGE